MKIELICQACQKSMEFVDRVGFREDCPHCGEDAHSCLNCDFYDSGAYHECRESSADFVKEKHRANYCDYFQARRQKDSASDPADQLKAAAEALFKK